MNLRRIVEFLRDKAAEVVIDEPEEAFELAEAADRVEIEAAIDEMQLGSLLMF